MTSFKAIVRVMCLALVVLALPSLARAVPMPLNGTWIVLDQNMDEGDFFTGGPWDWNSALSVVFNITDLFVVSDRFEVYDNGALVLTTTLVPNWDTYTADPFSDPNFTASADVAWLNAAFSKGTLVFAPGAHSLTIRDIAIPPVDAGGDDFIDGTVAFRATAVPEPMSLFLLGSGLTGLALRRRRR